MIRALIAVALALVLSPGWHVVKGKRLDVYSLKKSGTRGAARIAEEAAARFEDLLGSFPGDRAAVLLRPRGAPGDVADPPWQEAGAAWAFTVRQGTAILAVQPGSGTVFRPTPTQLEVPANLLAIRTLLEWSDRRAQDPPRGDGSGTRLPDWWEEAVGGWCDDQGARDLSRRTMATILSLGKSLPLDQMLTLVRAGDPGYADVPGVEVDPKDLPPWLPPEILDAIRRPTKARVLPAQSLSFLEYLVENEGVAFVRHVADLQARGLGLMNALPWLKEHAKERAKPKTPLPETIRDLEKAWLAWARARRP